MAEPMHPMLEKLCVGYSQALDDLSAEAMQMHPDGDHARWSRQQIIEHLLLTYRLTSRVLSERLEKGRVTQARTTLRQWLWKRIILDRRFFPQGAPAPENVLPELAGLEPLSGADLTALMREDLARMDGLLAECERKFGRVRVASHQMLGPLRVQQWRRFHQVHGRHHIKQIVRIQNDLTKKAHVPVDGIMTAEYGKDRGSAQERSEGNSDVS